ncbi:YbgA family protein [Bacillus sp. Brlt_9]|uniref:YbgA family protein n=1 Tax=Bacillus sp. Brlt_9 TaxID=3110916 RepID=UPI003F7B660A
MRQFAKPKIVVSKCLEFDACRYNGEMIPDVTIRNLQPFVTFIPICPEVEIGLGTPRETIRIVEENGVNRLVQPSTREDVTGKMEQFSNDFLQTIPDVDGFILKNRSPSCGTRDVKIYSGFEKAPAKGKGSGLFGGAVIKKFSHLPIEEEGRLSNFIIREHFFTRLFTIAYYKMIKPNKNMKELVSFQSDNKYLFMAYNQVRQKELGRIIANHKNETIEVVFDKYEKILYELFMRTPRYTSNINVCEHIFGYFKTKLKKQEKDHFFDLIQKYKEKKIPLSSLLTILKSWALRFDEKYLLRQTYFEPYPESLVEISDSGKGRDY